MKLWVVVTLVCVVVVVILVAIVRGLVLTRRKKAIEQAMDGATPPSDTIYVSIINDVEDTDAGAGTVLSLFKDAEAPLRVHVNVYDVVDTEAGRIATPSPFLLAVRARAKAAGFPIAKVEPNLRVLQVPGTLYRGRLPAREQLERYTFKDETYMMTIEPGATMVRKWDAALVNAYAAASAGPDGPDGPNRPGPTPSSYSSPILTTKLEVSADDAPTPSPDSPGTFVGFSAQAKFPALVAYKLREPQAADKGSSKGPPPFTQNPNPTKTSPPIPALAWCSSLTFTTGRRHKAFTIPPIPDAEEDSVMWTVLVRNGWTRWVHPARTVAVVKAEIRAGSTAGVDTLMVPEAAALKVLGLHEGSLQPSTRARVGLSASPTLPEIVAKLGSMDEYASLLSRVELTNI